MCFNISNSRLKWKHMWRAVSVLSTKSSNLSRLHNINSHNLQSKNLDATLEYYNCIPKTFNPLSYCTYSFSTTNTPFFNNPGSAIETMSSEPQHIINTESSPVKRNITEVETSTTTQNKPSGQNNKWKNNIPKNQRLDRRAKNSNPAPENEVLDRGYKPEGCKVKYALIVSYNGTGYRGLQMNPGTKTIEQDIEEAIYKAGYIAEANHKILNKVSWTRAARTDKGVHAAGNVVALKVVVKDEVALPATLKLKNENVTDDTLILAAHEKDYDNGSVAIVESINQHLPAQIRVLRAVRVLNSFDSKNHASSRTYEYIIPSYAFIPIEKYPPGVYEDMIKNVPTIAAGGSIENIEKAATSMELEEKEEKNDDDDNKSTKNDAKKQKITHNTTETTDADSSIETTADSEPKTVETEYATVSDTPAEFLNYRMTSEDRARVDSVLSTFCGTKNHHNFTKGRTPNDASCRRYITSFVTTGFFYVDGVEYLHMVVHGQSFMLHQIRKMVGYTIARCRGGISPELDTTVFDMERIRVPIAPALGLLLDRVHFKLYDLKIETTNKNALHNKAYHEIREPMDNAFSKSSDDIKAFKEKWIYPEICHKELKVQSCWRWLHWINDHDYWGQPQEDGTKHRCKTSGKLLKPAMTSAEDFTTANNTNGMEYVNVVPKTHTTVTLPSYAKPSEDIKDINEDANEKDLVI